MLVWANLTYERDWFSAAPTLFVKWALNQGFKYRADMLSVGILTWCWYLVNIGWYSSISVEDTLSPIPILLLILFKILLCILFNIGFMYWQKICICAYTNCTYILCYLILFWEKYLLRVLLRISKNINA